MRREDEMNKAELVEEVANQTGLAKKTSREAVDGIISAITDSLGREEKVTLVGFGTLSNTGFVAHCIDPNVSHFTHIRKVLKGYQSIR
jgi:hypothetical protein